MNEILTRRNPVLESLRSQRRQIIRLWLQNGLDKKLTAPILQAARAANVTISHSDKQKLTKLAKDGRHQGVVLECGPYPYAEVDEMLGLAERRGERPFLLLLDLLHGPQNIGQLLRTAEAVGVHGVILQDRRAPDITPAVVQYSAGAAEHLLIAQETNLVQTMRWLQERNVWLVGMELGHDAQKLEQVDLDMSIGIVVGHEGQGLRRLVRDTCDILLELPMRGRVESLNAAASGSILLYAAWQARGYS